MKSIATLATFLIGSLLCLPAAASDGSLEGRWTAEQRSWGGSDGIWLQLKTVPSGDRHGLISMTIPAADLTGFGVGSDVRFELRRAAGVVAFTGAIDAGGRGSGRFTFRPDPGFTGEMGELGYRELSLDQTFEAALFGVTADFVRELAAHGYTEVPARKLIELRIHGIDGEFLERVSGRSEIR